MFTLNSNDPIPLYQQLYQQIREHVLSGKLPADSRLPSVRELAAELAASRNTVEGAYQELVAEGYIYSRERSGYFVSALDQEATRFPKPGNLPAAAFLRSLQPAVASIFIPPASTSSNCSNLISTAASTDATSFARTAADLYEEKQDLIRDCKRPQDYCFGRVKHPPK